MFHKFLGKCETIKGAERMKSRIPIEYHSKVDWKQKSQVTFEITEEDGERIKMTIQKYSDNKDHYVGFKLLFFEAQVMWDKGH